MLMTNVEHNVGLIYLCIGHMHQVELYLDDLLPKVVDLRTVSFDILCNITSLHFSRVIME